MGTGAVGHKPFPSYARAAGNSSRPARLGVGDPGGPAARGLGFLVMMGEVRLLNITPADVPEYQPFRDPELWPSTPIGADKTEPHVSNIWTSQKIGRQGKDVGISLSGGGGLEICFK